MRFLLDPLQLGNLFYTHIAFILFGLPMGGLLVYCFFTTREKSLSYKNQISLLEAQSLWAQMNPHFIFNVLNGLQSTLILKDEQEINQYMGHLSNLLRLTLELSKKEAVTLAEEIDYLKSYIELQSLRLNKTLDYCFDTSIDLKLSEIFIPPLLIKPKVENAILHGIIPSRSKGILVVGFKEIYQGVCITVEDNGIGVEKSKKTI